MRLPRLEMRFGVWCLVLLLSALLFGVAVQRDGLIVTALIAFCAAAVSVFSLFNLANSGNRETLRVLDALLHGDMSQTYSGALEGAGLSELRARCEQLLARTNQDRTGREQQLRETTYMLEHVPMALLRIREDGQVELLNHAARNLCTGLTVRRVEDLSPLGEEPVSVLSALPTGKTASVALQVAGRTRSYAALTSQVSSNDAQWTLVSLLDIQGELDRVQLQAWQQLVSVLTHELMNSITPIASLAVTTGELLNDVREGLPENVTDLDSMADMADALNTIARRSEGLRDFVQGYRTLSKMPQPQPVELHLTALLEEVLTLFREDKGVPQISLDIQPDSLSVWADRDQLHHVLLNLLRNAADACANTAQGEICIRAVHLKEEQVEIRVADNGPGIDDAHVGRVFMPFFTTKREGSGVGLALTRQVMLAHGGSVTAHNRPEGGAEFVLRF